eukprot:316612-Chlamydomonas_euryale.AAC.5
MADAHMPMRVFELGCCDMSSRCDDTVLAAHRAPRCVRSSGGNACVADALLHDTCRRRRQPWSIPSLKCTSQRWQASYGCEAPHCHACWATHPLPAAPVHGALTRCPGGGLPRPRGASDGSGGPSSPWRGELVLGSLKSTPRRPSFSFRSNSCDSSIPAAAAAAALAIVVAGARTPRSDRSGRGSGEGCAGSRSNGAANRLGERRVVANREVLNLTPRCASLAVLGTQKDSTAAAAHAVSRQAPGVVVVPLGRLLRMLRTRRARGRVAPAECVDRRGSALERSPLVPRTRSFFVVWQGQGGSRLARRQWQIQRFRPSGRDALPEGPRFTEAAVVLKVPTTCDCLQRVGRNSFGALRRHRRTFQRAHAVKLRSFRPSRRLSPTPRRIPPLACLRVAPRRISGRRAAQRRSEAGRGAAELPPTSHSLGNALRPEPLQHPELSCRLQNQRRGRPLQTASFTAAGSTAAGRAADAQTRALVVDAPIARADASAAAALAPPGAAENRAGF